METLLVAFDGSPPSLRALDFAMARDVPGRSPVIHVVNVQPIPVVGGDLLAGQEIPGLRRGTVEKARHMLEPAEKRLSGSGIPFQTHIRFGYADREIVELARQLACNQIVMGTHGAGALKGWVLGSIATKVVHLADIPVTLVK